MVQLLKARLTTKNASTLLYPLSMMLTSEALFENLCHWHLRCCLLLPMKFMLSGACACLSSSISMSSQAWSLILWQLVLVEGLD